MAELAASMVVGPLLSLLKDKASNYLLDKYKVMEGMEKQRRILEDKLPAILDIIDDAEKQASRQRAVQAWLARLKKAAYEASEVFDDFEYEALRRQAKKNGHISELGFMAGVKLLPTHNRLAFRLKMGTKLRSIVGTIEVLVDDMNKFGFNSHRHQVNNNNAPRQEDWKWREMDSILVDDAQIVSISRAEERNKIIDMLVNGQASNGDLMIVPIVGMGGLGKTTLAQLIYTDPRVQQHFSQLRRWVCVSNDFNVCNLANKICSSSEANHEDALKKLQEHLSGKRYLLVLDDIWDEDNFSGKWDKLKACLKQGGVGSAILTTTRDKKIAQLMGTTDISQEMKYHVVSTLSKKFIEEIIATRAFGLQKRNKKDELVNLVGPIADKCAGSPLAAKALGSVLSNKTTKHEWEDVLQRSSVCDNETGILPILKLSYDDLPTYMKQCFAFCALYPKDDHINKDNLIQLWMANGFFSDQKKVHAETMGEHIVKEMVSRSFFEYVERDSRSFGYSSTTFLKIHDLMHDVAVSASEKECAYLTHEMDQSNELLPSSVRHILYPESKKQGLSILFDSLSKVTTPIQTLMLGEIYNEQVQHSSKYSSVRALALLRLQGHGHSSIKPKHLHHLRYLDLSNSDMQALPDDISILYNLRTLKLSSCWKLRRLPKQMKYMTSLRHLYTKGCDGLACMPPELGRLTSLQTVTCFVVGSGGEGCSGLGELKDLNIGGSLELTRLENVAKATSAKSANLGKKKELRQLSLRWTRGEEQEEEKQCGHGEVLEALEAHDGLLALEIYSYQGNRFPPWMCTLKNMVELQLSDCKKAEQLPPFRQLPELQLLSLEGLGNVQSLSSRCTPSMFGKLKNLSLADLDGFDSFFSEAGHGEVVAFPQLEVLYIRGCKSLKALPEGAVVVLSETHGGGDNNAMARSAFPRLKRLTLKGLRSLERWEAADAALEIKAEQPWEAVDGLEVVKAEQRRMVVFPLLETVRISRCPQLTTLPRALKLGELAVRHAKEDMPTLELSDVVNVDDGKEEERSWDQHMSSVTVMCLHWSDGFFLGSRALLALWACFGQLQDLTIGYCHKLEYWPEKEFEGLVSLRTLTIDECNSLVGYAAHAAATDGQATTSSEEEERRSQLLPRLESLEIWNCGSLVEVLNAPAHLKRICIEWCGKLVSLSLLSSGNKQLQDKTPSSSSLKHHQGGGSSITDDVAASAAGAAAVHEDEEEHSLPAAASTTSHHQDNSSLPLPSSSSLLESLEIYSCGRLSEVLSLPPSLRKIEIGNCSNLRLLSAAGQMHALKEITIYECPELRSLESILIPAAAVASLESLYLADCKSLASLPPSEPHEAGYYYSSLRKLTIRRCPAIKSLPPALQQRLDSLEKKNLDARLEAGGGLLGRLCSKLPPSWLR